MNCLVVGLKKSGIASCELLSKKGHNVFAFDKDKKIFDELQFAKILPQNVKKIEKLSKKTLKNINLVVVSPGVDTKTFEKKLPEKTEILSEIELAFKTCKSPVLAITGTNGKTTTVNLLFKMLEEDGKKSCLVGNVGIPFSENAEKDFESFVCELSSFQLEHIKTFKPKIAGFLNIEPDHLDRHKTFENYFLAKQNIFKNMDKSDFLVLNADDILLKNLRQKTKAKTFFFSLCCLPNGMEGAFFENNNLVLKLKGSTEIISLTHTKLFGKHNISNLLCACLMAKLFGVKTSSIQKVVDSFVGLNHRITFVGEKNGVKFFDDSKATNIHSCLTACECFSEKTLLFLGGLGKGENFFRLFSRFPKNVKTIICFGKIGKKLQKIAKKSGFLNAFFAKTLFDAFSLMKKVLSDEKIVLLSPACASFDEFSGYDQRGDFFQDLVKDFLSEKKDC